MKLLLYSEINEELENENIHSFSCGALISAHCSSAVIKDGVFQSCTPTQWLNLCNYPS